MNLESVNDVDAREEVTREMVITWGSAAFSAHYRDRLGANGIMDATVGHSRSTSDLIHVEDHPRARDDNGELYDPPPDTGLFGHEAMGESRADLKMTVHAPVARIIAGAQATRFEADHDFRFSEDCWDGYCYWNDMDLTAYFHPLALRETRWRLAAYSTVETPLRRGFSARGGLRLDRFPGLATEFSPFAELGYAASWWDARISAARPHQAMASGAQRGVAVCELRRLRPSCPGERTADSPQHRVLGRVGWLAGAAQSPAGRLHARAGQHQAAGVRVQPDRGRGAGESCAVGVGQRYGAGSRGVLELGAGPGVFGSGNVQVGQGVAHRVFANLHAALSS